MYYTYSDDASRNIFEEDATEFYLEGGNQFW